MKLSLHQFSTHAQIELPASKSISHRALMIHFLCKSSVEISNLSTAHDTLLFSTALDQIRNQQQGIIDIEDAGTPARFLVALLACQEGKEFTLTGTSRMKQRPMAALVQALRSLGAEIESLEEDNCLPLRIQGRQLKGGDVYIDASASSQFISALCMIAPLMNNGLNIHLLGKRVSESYIQMTSAVMTEWGVDIEIEDTVIRIPTKPYHASTYQVEGDWSSATFFYAMLMLQDQVSITLKGLSAKSIQGDAKIQHWAKDFGVSTTFDEDECTMASSHAIRSLASRHYDMTHHPDLAIPFIVACALQYPSTTFSGLHHLEFKESKRLTALQQELAKVGIHLHYEHDHLSFEGQLIPAENEILLQTYQDHRMAMSLSLLAIKGYSLQLDDASCVRKSFPDFWNQLSKLGFEIKP
ncbi:MAG TPA: 3-phosphoshikimate 1-carboxyvinyltransferase [Chitinophagaceae bacterium]|nr:3-phosphoshikimate 1-carboxyvinyltransferase [Chitinophagaceae bacterium]